MLACLRFFNSSLTVRITSAMPIGFYCVSVACGDHSHQGRGGGGGGVACIDNVSSTYVLYGGKRSGVKFRTETLRAQFLFLRLRHIVIVFASSCENFVWSCLCYAAF